MNKAERQAKMDQFFAGMDADEKKEMCATMMGKMMEGSDMKEMMPEMMTGMMSGECGDGSGKMQEMMLKKMMPHCIGMMLPAIEVEKRGDVAAGILAAIVEKGSVGMSEDQLRSFFGALEKVLKPSA